MSCESSSFNNKSVSKIECRSSAEYADAGYFLTIYKSNKYTAKLTTITFAGESTLYEGFINILSTNDNSDSALIESLNKSLVIESKGSKAIVIMTDNKKVSDDFANLNCNNSIRTILN